MKTLLVILFILSASATASAQDHPLSLTALSAGVKQCREGANFGLVFTGPDVQYRHSYGFPLNHSLLSLETAAGLGVLFSKDIAGLNIHLKPVESSWQYSFPGNSFSIGPSIRTEYFYCLYPDLQSGFDYWFTHFSLGMNAGWQVKIGRSQLEAGLKTTLFGFTSRQPEKRSPYFYDLGFFHAIRHIHSGLRASTIRDYQVMDFELRWKPGKTGAVTWGYNFSYAGYNRDTEYTSATHSITVQFIPGKQR